MIWDRLTFLDVTVFNLGNLARQTIQRQEEPRMLRLIVNQTSHITMLVEGTSLAVSQWDRKLREANWTLGSSDDHHNWVGVSTAYSGTSVKKLVDNCGSEQQKIWHTIFEVTLGEISTGYQVWKSGQSVYRLMVVHVNHAVARTACRSCRINFADLLILCAHFQVDLTGGDFQCLQLQVLQDWQPADCSFSARFIIGSDAPSIRQRDQCSAQGVYDNHPEYQFRTDIYITYHDERIWEYCLMRDVLLDEVTDAAGESPKIPRLQRALQEFDENFDAIGLASFNWDHTRNKPLNIDNRYLLIIKNKYAIRYLADCQAWRRRLQLSCYSSDRETRTCTEFSRLHCTHGQRWQG